MSAQTIARWNAIPMSRPDTDTQDEQDHTINSMKRSHQDVDNSDNDDDDVSLVSRSPSPPLNMDVEKYDEYVHGPAREVITVETRIKSTNKGFEMLAKLGWSEGQPLGLSSDARVDPIPFQVKNDLTGLGKTTQDFRMIETTVAERRKLDSERQRRETEDQRKAREDDAARRAALKSEITDTLKAFYCALCEKQFQNVAQYDEHTNSYAHHHRARLRDMQANTRMTSQEDVDRRKEKERKREEKELRKIAKAAGIKMAKPITTPVPAAPTLAPVGEPSLSSEPQPSNLKKAGWSTVSTIPDPATSSRRSGWTFLDPGTSPASSTPAPAPPAPASHRATTTFRTGGWTSLDTGSSLSVNPPPSYTIPPPPPPPNVAPPPPPLCPPPFAPANTRTPSGPPPLLPTSAPSPGEHFPSTPGGWGSAITPSASRGWNQISAPEPTASPPRSPPPASATLSTSGSLKAPVPPPATPQARTGWQQWKRGSSSKRR